MGFSILDSHNRKFNREEIMDKEYLHSQLVKLGDMMGDGLHHEPDGKWIEKEYRKVARALGLTRAPKRKRADPTLVNSAMESRLEDFRCNCGGRAKQTRSGSMRAKCVDCGAKYQILKRKTKK